MTESTNAIHISSVYDDARIYPKFKHAVVTLFIVGGIICCIPKFDAFTTTIAYPKREVLCQTKSRIVQEGGTHIYRERNVNTLSYATSPSTENEISTVVDSDNTNQLKGTVQILMSDTGGGHRASANAIRDAFDTLYPNQVDCDIVDIYTDYGPVWPYNEYVSIYKYMASNPWMWLLLYEFGKSDFGLWFNQVMLEIFCTDAFTTCIQRPNHITGRRADMIISVHPLTQELPMKILSNIDTNIDHHRRRTTPFCTVVTDLGSAHPTWFHPSVDKCFVPSDALYNAAQQRGLQPQQIVQYGLPIRKGFWSSSSLSDHHNVSNQKQIIRQRLNLDEQLPTVLVVGGGDGMGGLVDISIKLGTALNGNTMKSQMVVICGKNEDAKKQLEHNVPWGDNIIVSIHGFVNNMDEFMKSSDVLVTKAGPGTIAEASICGLPCMMFSFLPGQEEGNIPFVENAGFGKYSNDPTEIATIVSRWLSCPDELQKMQQAAIVASRPNATLDIARDLADILFQHTKQSLN